MTHAAAISSRSLSKFESLDTDARRSDILLRTLGRALTLTETGWFAQTCSDGVRIESVVGSKTDQLSQLLVPGGSGLTGKVASTGRPERVEQYFASRRITHDFDRIVASEDITGMLGVPVACGDRAFGVLTIAARSNCSSFSDRRIDDVRLVARSLGEVLNVIQEQEQRTIALLERQRDDVASWLHDEVAAQLFSISASLVELRGAVAADGIPVVERIEARTADLQHAVRCSLESVRTWDRQRSLAADCRAVVTAFEKRCGVRADMAVLTDMPELDAERHDLVVRVVRAALLNVEKHAMADRVLVTLSRSIRELNLCVIDDGCGPTGNSEVTGHGLRDLGRRAQQVAAHVSLGREDDSTVLRMRMPIVQ